MTTFKYFLINTLFVIYINLGAATTTPYNVPKPRIVVLKPRGLEVSIPDSPGVQLFAFHGNINQPLNNIEAGQLSQDILRRENDRWVFRDRNLKLNKGDTINFWLYVMKDNLGYRSLDNTYTVTDNDDDVNYNNINDDHIKNNLGSGKATDRCNSTTQCDRVLVNLTETLLSLQHDLEDLRETNRLLIDMVEKSNMSKTLRLHGVGNTFDDAIDAVRVILRGRLQLPSIDVVKADYYKAGNIMFDVSTLNEKIAIIKSAKANLKNSKFDITY